MDLFFVTFVILSLLFIGLWIRKLILFLTPSKPTEGHARKEISKKRKIFSLLFSGSMMLLFVLGLPFTLTSTKRPSIEGVARSSAMTIIQIYHDAKYDGWDVVKETDGSIEKAVNLLIRERPENAPDPHWEWSITEEQQARAIKYLEIKDGVMVYRSAFKISD